MSTVGPTAPGGGYPSGPQVEKELQNLLKDWNVAINDLSAIETAWYNEGDESSNARRLPYTGPHAQEDINALLPKIDKALSGLQKIEGDLSKLARQFGGAKGEKLPEASAY